MKTKELYNDLIENVDNIYPKFTLVRGLNNKESYVSVQAILDYIENKMKHPPEVKNI